MDLLLYTGTRLLRSLGIKAPLFCVLMFCIYVCTTCVSGALGGPNEGIREFLRT